MGRPVSRRCSQGGGGEVVGTATYIPQNALIILNIHKWGISSGSHQSRSDPKVKSLVIILFCVFHQFLNSPQNSEHFEYKHMW